MKIILLLSGVLTVSLLAPIRPVWAQPDPVVRPVAPINGLDLPLISPDAATKLALPNEAVALHLRDVTLEAALKELQKQSGVELEFGWAERTTLDKKLSIDIETRSFTEAFNAILDEANVKATLRHWGGEESWHLEFNQTQDGQDSPQSGVGPFQLRLKSVDASFGQSVQLGADKAFTRSETRGLSLGLEPVLDPMLRVTGKPKVTLTVVEDDQKRSLLQSERNDWFVYDFDGNYYSGATQLKVPETGAKKITRIEGKAVYVVPSKFVRWEIADITNNKGATHEFSSNKGTVRVTVKRASRNEDEESDSVNLALEMLLVDAQGEADQSRSPLFSFGLLRSAVHLEDAAGHVLRSNGYNGSSSNNKITMSGQFHIVAARGPRVVDENGQPAEAAAPTLTGPVKLVFDGPTEWAQTEVPFSFSDVPLPG